MELHARQTIFAEGRRGPLTKTLMRKFGLCEGAGLQTYGIGIKEGWELRPERHLAGLIVHATGLSLDRRTYGGSFI